MTGRLERFLADARRRVERGAYDLAGEALQANGSLVEALQVPSAIIAELKPRSPSGGDLLGDRNLQDILDAYNDGGAAAISVLTDADHFDGSPDLLRAANAVGLPTLMKDFVVDPAQIEAAAHHGASAVLLIERCFAAPQEREAIVDEAHAAGLEVLLEVHGEAEWQQAKQSHAELIGINARDLDTLNVDLDGARGVIEQVAGDGRTTVALSGIHNRATRRHMQAAGAHACLVGTGLMQAPDPALWLRALRRPLAKVCGIARSEDLEVAASVGADLVGFVVGADTPRAIEPAAAARLIGEARELGVRTVLVTPSRNADQVAGWLDACAPDFVQPTRPDVAQALATEHRVLQALATDQEPADGVAGLVLDTPSEHGVGGTGESHDWDACAAFGQRHPGLFYLVAGGLTAENVVQALTDTGAWGVDASSGLEAEPGQKDAEHVKAYVAAAHQAP